MKRKWTITADDQVVVSCSKCGHKHRYESLEALEKSSLSTLCENCGFLFLHHVASKIDTMLFLLKSDPKADALLKEGRFEEFERYFKEKTEP